MKKIAITKKTLSTHNFMEKGNYDNVFEVCYIY